MKKIIYTEENFISPNECQELIELSKANPDEIPYGDESRGGNTYLTTLDGIYFESQKNNAVDKVTNVMMTTDKEIFTLHLVPKESIRNEVSRVKQKYPTSSAISASVEKILQDVLKTDKTLDIEQTSNKF